MPMTRRGSCSRRWRRSPWRTPTARCRSAKGALRDAIFATKDFQGLTGTLTCSPTGDCGAPVIAVYEITQENVDAAQAADGSDLADPLTTNL